ncbi:hypothetical protein [Rouxiella aceris]|nr:hypothetical protein [Rouxiella aceris]
MALGVLRVIAAQSKEARSQLQLLPGSPAAALASEKTWSVTC